MTHRLVDPDSAPAPRPRMKQKSPSSYDLIYTLQALFKSLSILTHLARKVPLAVALAEPSKGEDEGADSSSRDSSREAPRPLLLLNRVLSYPPRRTPMEDMTRKV